MASRIDWSPSKNAELRARYGIGFERVLVALADGALLMDRRHSNVDRYGHQRQLVVDIEGYAWVVPYVADGDVMFLKTMYPSRQATKLYVERRLER